MDKASYTAVFKKPAPCILTHCKISAPYDAAFDTEDHPEYKDISAIWDTGAMCSTISADLVSALGIKPLGQVNVSHVDGVSVFNQYVVNVLLPNKIEVQMLIVNDGKLNDADLLIGMDVISLCDFAITNVGDSTKFSFQIPSLTDIDFNA